MVQGELRWMVVCCLQKSCGVTIWKLLRMTYRSGIRDGACGLSTGASSAPPRSVALAASSPNTTAGSGLCEEWILQTDQSASVVVLLHAPGQSALSGRLTAGFKNVVMVLWPCCPASPFGIFRVRSVHALLVFGAYCVVKGFWRLMGN